MARRNVNPPAQCRQAAEAAITNLSPVLAESGREIGDRQGVQPASVPSRDALPVYTLGVEDIIDRRRLAGAEYAGWQFLQQSASGVIGTEVHNAPDGKRHVFAQFNMGPFPAGIAAALRELSTRSLEPDEYEVRLLRIPALHLEALWLKSGTDRIIPLAPAPEPLTAGEVYGSERFFVELEPRAAESIRFDNSPRTGSNEPW